MLSQGSPEAVIKADAILPKRSLPPVGGRRECDCVLHKGAILTELSAGNLCKKCQATSRDTAGLLAHKLVILAARADTHTR